MKVDDALLARARRMATRKRAEAACLPCKLKKAKCNDYRPCKRCLDSGSDLCVDGSSPARSNSPERLESGQDLPKDGSSAAKNGVAPAFTAGEAVSSHSSLPSAGYAIDRFRNSAGRDFRSAANNWNTQPASLSPLVSWIPCTTHFIIVHTTQTFAWFWLNNLASALIPLTWSRRHRARTTPGRSPGSPFLLHLTRTRTRQPPSPAASVGQGCATATRIPRSPPGPWTRSNAAAVTSTQAAQNASPPTRRPKAKRTADPAAHPTVPRRPTAARPGPTSGCGRARGPGRRTTHLIRSGPGGDGAALGPGWRGGPMPHTFQARWAGKQGPAGGRVRETIVFAGARARVRARGFAHVLSHVCYDECCHADLCGQQHQQPRQQR